MHRYRVLLRYLLAVALLPTVLLHNAPCHAWGDDGHRAIAEVARHYLTPATRQRIDQLLATDSGPLSAPDMAGASVWADKYRDSDRDGARLRYRQTYRWHFINLDLQHPDLEESCFGHPPLRRDQPAARGPARACIVDKIVQFRAEWLAPDTAPAERLLALRFLLHLVGDLHQPLHASDNDDQGGNQVTVSGGGLKNSNLHRFWDTQVVRRLAPNAARLAPELIGGISEQQRGQWQRGDVAAWALESNALAKSTVYGDLPQPQSGRGSRPGDNAGQRISYRLPDSYLDNAETVAALQLRKAGVRLALLLEPDNGKLRAPAAR